MEVVQSRITAEVSFHKANTQSSSFLNTSWGVNKYWINFLYIASQTLF